MELTITTDRNKQWSRTIYVVDEETFVRIFQILKENDESISKSAQQSVQRTAIAACNCPAFRPHPDCPIHSGGATRR